MSVREWLAVAMFISFILGILTGFPVAWILGGIAILFTAIAIIVERDFGFYTGVDWSYASLVGDRIMEEALNVTRASSSRLSAIACWSTAE